MTLWPYAKSKFEKNTDVMIKSGFSESAELYQSDSQTGIDLSTIMYNFQKKTKKQKDAIKSSFGFFLSVCLLRFFLLFVKVSFDVDNSLRHSLSSNLHLKLITFLPNWLSRRPISFLTRTRSKHFCSWSFMKEQNLLTALWLFYLEKQRNATFCHLLGVK